MGALIEKKARQREAVLAALRRKRKLNTHSAATMLQVSDCTVRRLFEELECNGDIIRVHGGAQLPPNKGLDYHFENLQQRQSEQKQRIGEYACRLIDNGDTIFLDSGTTIQQMSYLLAEQLRRTPFHDIQIYTNSLRNLQILADYCDVSLIGGLFRSRRQDFCGYFAEKVLEMLSFKKCFLSADGIGLAPDEGVMATDVNTAKLNHIILHRADNVYLLADSTKFARRSFVQYATLDDIDTIITDKNLDEKYIQEFSKYDIELQLV